jgi:hypothetical protein
LGPRAEIDGRLTGIERGLHLLLNVTPINAAEAWADFERSDFGTVPTLRLRPLEFDPDVVRRHLYNLEIENVTQSFGSSTKLACTSAQRERSPATSAWAKSESLFDGSVPAVEDRVATAEG